MHVNVASFSGVYFNCMAWISYFPFIGKITLLLPMVLILLVLLSGLHHHFLPAIYLVAWPWPNYKIFPLTPSPMLIMDVHLPWPSEYYEIVSFSISLYFCNTPVLAVTIHICLVHVYGQIMMTIWSCFVSSTFTHKIFTNTTNGVAALVWLDICTTFTYCAYRKYP
jgi:hypothetical protein